MINAFITPVASTLETEPNVMGTQFYVALAIIAMLIMFRIFSRPLKITSNG